MGPSNPGTRGPRETGSKTTRPLAWCPGSRVPWPPLFRRIGQQGQLSGAFDGSGQDALVPRTVPGDTAGENLSALRDEPAQTGYIPVVHGIGLLAAEFAVPALWPPPPPL